MKRELTIQVCGLAGHGKTLIAKQLENFLISKGVKVERVIDDYNREHDDRDEEKLLVGLIKGGFKVKIECV